MAMSKQRGNSYSSASSEPSGKLSLDLAKLTSVHKGVALIIGNDYPGSSKPLCGARNDARLLDKVFDYLQFLTFQKHNVRKSDLKLWISDLVNYTYPDTCKRIVFTFSGHGDSDTIRCVQDVPYKVDDIVKEFTVDNLAHIPRLLFFDACRGTEETKAVSISRCKTPENYPKRIPTVGNILIAYATTIGYVSNEHRDEKFGYWTRVLADELVSSDKTILDVLTMVCERLSERYREELQQPQLTSGLREYVRLLTESGQERLKDANKFVEAITDGEVNIPPTSNQQSRQQGLSNITTPESQTGVVHDESESVSTSSSEQSNKSPQSATDMNGYSEEIKDRGSFEQKLRSFLKPIEANWEDFATQLGVKSFKIENIKANFDGRNDMKKACREMFTLWRKNMGRDKRKWSTIKEAARASNNRTMFQTLQEKVPADADDTEPEMKDLQMWVFPHLGDDWEEFGGCLGLDQTKLRNIRASHYKGGDRECLHQTIEHWCKTTAVLSWRPVLDALENIGATDVKEDIEDSLSS